MRVAVDKGLKWARGSRREDSGWLDGAHGGLMPGYKDCEENIEFMKLGEV